MIDIETTASQVHPTGTPTPKTVTDSTPVPRLGGTDSTTMLPAAQVVESMKSPGLGFERVEFIQGSTYRDNSTVILCPTRGMINHRVASSLQQIMAPMNQKRSMYFCVGDEVGKAYAHMLGAILKDPELSKWKYVMTVEDDNLIPADAHVRLLETIEWGKYDAVSGIYFTKGFNTMPMAYGDPEEYRETGVIDFKPRNVAEALSKGHVMEVNGIAMGCALWRMDLFREIAAPWFVTVADVIPDKGPTAFTQDLYFCYNATKAGKRFAVDMRVKVGHLDINDGVVY